MGLSLDDHFFPINFSNFIRCWYSGYIHFQQVSFILNYRIIQQSHPSFNNVMLIGVMLCLLAIVPLGEFYLHEKQIYETHDVCCLLWGRPWRQVCHSHSVPSGLWYWDLASHPGVHPGLWCHVQQSLESPLDGIQKQGGPTSTRDQGKLTNNLSLLGKNMH